MPVPSTSSSQLRSHLRDLGVRSGMALAVHSNLITFGRIEGGAAMVLDLLWDMIGDQGTLILPAYTMNLTSDDIFDPLTTPSHGMGALTEYGRKNGGMLRSYSPTHSHVFAGCAAERLQMGDPARPLGAGSDFHRMHEEGVFLLLLGCTFQQGATFIHHVEAMKGVPYREWIEFPRRIRYADGIVQDLDVHYYGRRSGTQLRTELQSVEAEVTARSVGQRRSFNSGNSYLIELSELDKVVSDMIDDDPYALMVRNTDGCPAS